MIPDPYDAYNGCNPCRYGRHDSCRNKECFGDEHKCCCDCRWDYRQKMKRLEEVGK